VISLFYFSLQENTEKQIASHALSVAGLAASRLDVTEAYLAANPRAGLTGIADEIVRKTNAVFVVFMDRNAIRYTHPNPDLVGKRFTGADEGPALTEGRAYISKAVGISGPSIRAFAPVTDHTGGVLGAVAVGYWEPDIAEIIWRVFKVLYIIVPISLVAIGLFSFLLARNIKHTLFGMEPREIATQLKERETMLESVREGIIAIDADCKVTVANSAARSIFAPEQNIIGRHVNTLIPNTRLPIVMRNQRAELDEPMLLNSHMVIVNRIPLVVNNRPVGAVSTFRDMTEMNALAEELTGAKTLVDSLRARSHEFMNKLQAVSGLIQLGAYQEARSYITGLAAKEQSFIEFLLKNINSPATAGLLEGKSAEAQELNVTFTVDPDSRLAYLPAHFDDNAMVVVLGNLIQNALDAARSKPPGKGKVEVLLRQDEEEIRIRVADNGSGIPDNIANQIFRKGFTTKEFGMGYGLANAKARIELASGQIRVKSGDTGTEFTVTIPNEKPLI
jgi:sensor histidine kinase regulating citrate/malate metabolism